MQTFGRRRERLHHLIDLARGCRCWSRSRLAKALNRSSTRLYPDTDNPKLDLLVALADVLEWPVDAVADYIWSGLMPDIGLETAAPQDDDYDALLDQTRQAFREGKYAETVKLARRLLSLAQTPTQRAMALNKQAMAWHQMGRYTKARDTRQKGLLEIGAAPETRLVLQVNQAATLAALSEYAAAHGIAHEIVQWFKENPPDTPSLKMSHAFAHYVLGSVSHSLVTVEPSLKEHHARNARADFERCADLYETLASELKREELQGIAHACRGGTIVAEAEMGVRRPEAAVASLLDALPESLDGKECVYGEWIEGYGWRAVFCGELAVRHLHGAELQYAVAVCSEKAFDVADRMDNWEFRERALRMQFVAHEKLCAETGLKLSFPVDEENLRIVSGTIGRFPAFRAMGWQMLRQAKVVSDENAN